VFKFQKNTKIHFVGIGGIGMSGLAEILIQQGYKVSGSDVSESQNVLKLKDLGAEIYIGHREENIKDVTVLVYTSAVNETNPELMKAKADSIPIIKRAEMLAEIMRLKYGLAIAGTHGKTTTTSFLATILSAAKKEPSFIIGGIVKNLNAHAKIGMGDFLVAEADESDGSFLLLSPVMSVITNIDNDHLDHYKNEENIFQAFLDFANKVPFYGVVALCGHDKKLKKLSTQMKRRHVFFGIALDDPFLFDYTAMNIHYSLFSSEFDLYYKGIFRTKIKLNTPGKHNILNALGAMALAHQCDVRFDDIAKAVELFEGVGRRFQLLYSKNDFEVIDDYGHHPTEISSTLKIVKDTRASRKKIVIFEPHRFSRTRDCWNEFLHCFNDADELYLLPIYPASEAPIDGITTDRLIEDINRLHPNLARKLNSIDEVGKTIDGLNHPNTTLVTLGAGAIGKMARRWAKVE
jgi:UDP-N-acetylmuramate--alanine ligase